MQSSLFSKEQEIMKVKAGQLFQKNVFQVGPTRRLKETSVASNHWNKNCKKRLNICLVYPGYPPEEDLGGGISIFLKDFSMILHNLGHKVTVISRSERYTNKQEVKEGITVFRLAGINKRLECISACFSIRHFGIIDYSQRLLKLIKKIEVQNGSFDIIEGVDWGAEMYSLIRSKAYRKKAVIRCHNPAFISESFNSQNKPYFSQFVKDLEKYVIIKAKHVVAYSPKLIKMIGKECGKKTRYVRQTLFLKGKKILPKTTYSTNFSSRRKMKIVTVGRIEERKGIDVLIEAVQILLQHKCHVELHLIGSPTPMMNGIDSISFWQNKLRDYRDSIFFMGFIPYKHIVKLYRDYDLFVMASLFESWSLATVEALISGLPAVISDKCTIADYLENDQDCCIFQCGNPVQLAAKMQLLYQDYAKAVEMGKRGRIMLAKKYVPEKETNKIVEYYYSILQK